MAEVPKINLKVNVRGYVAGMAMASAKDSRFVARLQRVIPVPVWFIGWSQVNDRPRKRMFRFRWLFRGKRLGA